MEEFALKLIGSVLGSAIVLVIGYLALKDKIFKRLSAETQYEYKRQACLESLRIIDIYLSQLDIYQKDGSKLPSDFIAKEKISREELTKRVRECHSKLCLVCKDTKIIDTFINILTGSGGNTFVLLRDLRNLIRVELGFGEEVNLSKENIWIPTIGK